MEIIVRGVNIDVTEAIKAHIDSKVGNLTKFLPKNQELEAKVTIKVYNTTQKVEVTIPGKQFILRAEESHGDLYAAIDLVVDKLERQIRRHKTKANRKIREREGIAEYFINTAQGLPTFEEDYPECEPLKVKKLHLKPMDVEEAIMQLEMLGHDFYIYRDTEVEKVCVLYTREDGQYGLIETNH